MDGKGTMKLGSGAFEGAFSFSSRFEEATQEGCPVSAALAGVTITRIGYKYNIDHHVPVGLPNYL